MYLAELIISNHSLLWPGQHCLVPFGFAVVVFSSLRVLTEMTVIVISCTNCLLFIGAMVSMGSAGQLLMGIQQNWLPPSMEPGTFQRARCSTRDCWQRRRRKKFLQVFCLKIQAGFVLQGLFGSAWGSAAPGLQSPAELLWCSPQSLCAQQLQNPTRAPEQGQGWQLPQEFAVPCLVVLLSPEGAAGGEADASWHGRSDFIPVAAVYAAVW